MTTTEILTMLQREIHTTVFATVDDDGLPQTCVIDLMLCDDNGLYFLTAKGKSFYRRLMAKSCVALSGMKGTDTLSSIAISMRGRVTQEDEQLLASCYRSCLDLAAEHAVQSVAFCCISTGEFRFPNELAAQIATGTVSSHEAIRQGRIRVIFNVFKEQDEAIYKRLLCAED